MTRARLAAAALAGLVLVPTAHADEATPPPPAAEATDAAADDLAPPPRTQLEAWDLPPGADLAALGAELTPRRYAAPRDHTELVVTGALRVRGVARYNHDLDAGLDAAGQPLYPVPPGGGQWTDSGDLRARTDLAFYGAGVGVAVKARIDWLDDVGLGADPVAGTGRAPTPTVSPGQRSTRAVSIERAWGEVLTPLGVLAAGRMGAHFGLGMVASGGDCDDCSGGDAADRLAFVSPLLGHLVAVSYDLTASGPFTANRAEDAVIDVEPSDDVRTWTGALLRVAAPATRLRRAEAGRLTLEYAAYLTRRTQDRDVPASYLPVAGTGVVDGVGPGELVARGFVATSVGGWLRVTTARWRVEAEVAALRARVAQPSLIPGVELTQAATSRQLGLAVQTELRLGPAAVGLDGGLASGDDAPGFGAFPEPGAPAAAAGALDGPQASFPRDTTVDNFRFHPDYHVDQILFREIIGTVTDAVYLRPHGAVTVLDLGHGRLEAGAALIASWAMAAASTPSGAAGLGVEVDPWLAYRSRDGLRVAVEAGVLLPGPGFDRPGQAAGTASALRARVGFHF